MPAYNTLQVKKLFVILSGAMSCTLRIYILHQSTLRFMAAVVSSLCAIASTCVLPSIMSSELCGQVSMRAHMQLSHVYLVSTLDVTLVIKCTRLPLLIGESLGTRLGLNASLHD